MNDKHPTCPACGCNQVASILYGLPDDSDELREDLRMKRVTLGGCVVSDDDPLWHCNVCGVEW